MIKNFFFRRLRSSCNYLLAFDSMLNLIVTEGYFVPLVLAFTGNWLKRSTCIIVVLPAMLATESSSLMIIVIGLDRLIHVLFPIWCVFLPLSSVCGQKTTPLEILGSRIVSRLRIYGSGLRIYSPIVSFNNIILIRAKHRNQLKTAFVMASLSMVTLPYILFQAIRSIHTYSTPDQ